MVTPVVAPGAALCPPHVIDRSGVQPQLSQQPLRVQDVSGLHLGLLAVAEASLQMRHVQLDRIPQLGGERYGVWQWRECVVAFATIKDETLKPQDQRRNTGLVQMQTASLVADAAKVKHEDRAFAVMLALDEAPLLQGCSQEAKDLLSEHLTRITFDDGETVVRQGDLGDSMFFVMGNSTFELREDGKSTHIRAPGTFGERCLIADNPV